MLNTLRRIVQKVNAARDLDQALEIIVQQVKEAMAVDVCSIYLAEQDSQRLVLMATDGLNQQAVGFVSLGWDEGLVGLVAERAEPLNFDNAPNHPQYRYFPETGEERYHAFLGVPIIHHRQVLGVLVLQQHAESSFSDDEVTFLITIAAQLAGAIAHAEASGGVESLLQRKSIDNLPPLPGQPGAAGVAIGTAVVIHPYADIDTIPDKQTADIEAEIQRLDKAVDAVKGEILDMLERMRDALPQGDRTLFDAYLMMLESNSFIGSIKNRIEQNNWAPGALRETVQEHLRAFEAMEDEYLRERAQDVSDLGRRILQRMQQEEPKTRDYPKCTILVGEEITASMLAEVPPDRIAGVVSRRGSRTSHTAILARAMGIPAVLGVNDLPVGRVNGCSIITDGYSGRVYINPSVRVVREFERLRREEEQLSAGLSELHDQPAETPDGVRIPLYANSGLVSDIRPSLASGAEGVGLYRTEFPFMVRDRFPGEKEQCEVYRKVLESFHPRPVVMRTLDVGGDKSLPYFPIEEDNPFLGWRGIRITLDHPEIFLVQIRAMLKANVGLGNLQILLPMISNPGEVDEAMGLILRAYKELWEEGEEVTMPKIGVMIEVPSAVFQADHLAERVDFLSVGTNDLTQYLLAVDRNNARVAELYDSLHPAVLRALLQIMEAARRHNIPVSVCGEMAGDPAASVLLLAMGMNSLSMSAASLLRVKWVIRSFSHSLARELLDEALKLEDAHRIREHLNEALTQQGLGGLVRAGKN